MKTAYWNHSPLLLVTPQAANRTIGQGGFQEVEQMALFRDMVCYQEEVRDPVADRRGAEPGDREGAARVGAGADQRAARLLDPGRSTSSCRRSCGSSGRRAGAQAIAEAARLLSEARFPVILNGAGVVLADGIAASAALAERLGAPVACGYQHNDAFPGSASAERRAARLQRLEGGDGADRAGRRGAGARARGSTRSRRCRATGSTTGRRRRRSSRSTSTPTGSG